jgi:DsbC/DsbD-like thiol-disulfide interchange protein
MRDGPWLLQQPRRHEIATHRHYGQISSRSCAARSTGTTLMPLRFIHAHRHAAAALIAALALWPGVAMPAAAADSWVQATNSRVRLNWCGGAAGTTVAGASELAFVEMQLDPGWKTYWRSPGDAGVPPALEWAGSKNLAQATPTFPAPRRLVDPGGDSIGYKDRVIIPVRIERTAAQSPVTLAAQFSYGICKNICVPVEVTLASGCYDGGQSQEIAAAVGAVPRAPGQRRANDPALVAVTGSVAASAPKLTIDVDFGAGAADIDLFVEAPDGLYVPLPARATPDAHGRARFSVDLSQTLDPKDLLGKTLRLTMVSARGAAEALWVAK